MSYERLWRRREWLVLCSAATAVGWLPRQSLFAADPLAETTAARLKILPTCESITATWRYFGAQDKPFYEMTCAFGKDPLREEKNPFHRQTQLDREALLKLLDALAKDGFLGRSHDVSLRDFEPPPGYYLTLSAKKTGGGDEFKRLGWQSVNGDGHVELYETFGWDLKMIERLEKLQPALSGEAAKGMELLLGRLSGLKKEWQAAR